VWYKIIEKLGNHWNVNNGRTFSTLSQIHGDILWPADVCRDLFSSVCHPCWFFVLRPPITLQHETSQAADWMILFVPVVYFVHWSVNRAVVRRTVMTNPGHNINVSHIQLYQPVVASNAFSTLIINAKLIHQSLTKWLKHKVQCDTPWCRCDRLQVFASVAA